MPAAARLDDKEVVMELDCNAAEMLAALELPVLPEAGGAEVMVNGTCAMSRDEPTRWRMNGCERRMNG